MWSTSLSHLLRSLGIAGLFAIAFHLTYPGIAIDGALATLFVICGVLVQLLLRLIARTITLPRHNSAEPSQPAKKKEIARESRSSACYLLLLLSCIFVIGCRTSDDNSASCSDNRERIHYSSSSYQCYTDSVMNALASGASAHPLGTIIGAIGGVLGYQYSIDLIMPRRTSPRHVVLYFDIGDARLSSASRQMLDELAQDLQQPSTSALQIIGHADHFGSSSSNLRLSQERADAVAGYLIDRGVPSNAVRILARGDQEPREDAVNAQKNRRVEIFIQSTQDYAESLKILSTVYDLLKEPGGEHFGYGLYSYVLFPYYSDRVEQFLEVMIGTTPEAQTSTALRRELNVLLIPTKGVPDKKIQSRQAAIDKDRLEHFAKHNYDFDFSEKILLAVCRNPQGLAIEYCKRARGPGPVLATYMDPVSDQNEIPPPYLIVDLSYYNRDAMIFVLNAYKEQVMRSDFTDQERLESFRLNVLNWILFARDAIKEFSDALPNLSPMLFSRTDSK